MQGEHFLAMLKREESELYNKDFRIRFWTDKTYYKHTFHNKD